MPLKPDADEIAQYLSSLATSCRLDSSRRWWPKYVYHSTHVENAAAILESGRLRCRAQVQAGQLVKDSASQQIIAGLSKTQKRWVRLYLRPRAPTQYVNEGVRPPSGYEYGAAMPVPVYFLFSAPELLGEQGVSFTPGRLQSGASIGSTADDLREIPFKDVYHDGGVGQPGSERRAEILNARHAEVLVKNELALNHLAFVFCRSQPERQTLLNLLSQSARKRWSSRVVVQTHQNLFYKRGTHVEAVTLAADECVFRFYTSILTKFLGPFSIDFQWRGDDGWAAHWKRSGYYIPRNPLRFNLDPEHAQYQVTLRMDGDLIYQGSFEHTPPAPAVF